MTPIATRTPSDRLELHKALRLLHGDGPGRSADTDIDWPRFRDLSHSPIRDALAQEQLAAFVFEESGRQHPIPEWLWNGVALWTHAYDSNLVKVPIEQRVVSGYLLVDKYQFERLFAPIPAVASVIEQDYIPPYVAYLLEIAERFDLTAEYRFTRELMSAWIKKNPPPGVIMSDAKADNLTRLLGHPQFESGGQPGNITGKRSPDPCKPYQGVNYPKPPRRR